MISSETKKYVSTEHAQTKADVTKNEKPMT
jgi:hypothetical protein